MVNEERKTSNLQTISQHLSSSDVQAYKNANKIVNACIYAIENNTNLDDIETFTHFAHPKGLGDRFVAGLSFEDWNRLIEQAREDAVFEYLRIRAMQKQKIVEETGHKTAFLLK